MMREPLLQRNPDIGPITLASLVGIANAIEQEAVRRYGLLAESMESRGEAQTAAAFRTMLEEERAHVVAVARWAATLHEPVPEAALFEWRLPADLSKPWEEVARSARLTPYRAFAIAVDNEQRAFALYSYLAAQADDPAVAAQAEQLAREELRHAAVVRRWRRQAWHRERDALKEPLTAVAPAITSAAALHALLASREAAVVACQRALGARLRALGDLDSARLLEELAALPPLPPAAEASQAIETPASDNPAHLLAAAQAPLEALSETLEGIMRTTEGELFAQVEQAYSSVIARIAKIALQTERRLHPR
ncbi:MAG: ferritin family protein [Burkholderiales bacterium]|nr:ferritin family protein [Burkholderiales bacterium]